jgi:hypothetical protein
MSQSRTQNVEASEISRSVPILLTALLAVVVGVDVVLTVQPVWLDELSHAWRSVVAMRPVLAPAADALAASLAIASVVIASAVLLLFARAVQQAPHVSLAPAWVSLCILSVVHVHDPLPLPMSTPLFAALSALAFVGACTAFCSGTRAGLFFGAMLVALPFVVFARGYFETARGAFPFARDAQQLLVGLIASALGVVLLSVMQRDGRSPHEVPGLEGVDVVEELFSQVERAERAEARVAELERRLNADERPQPGVLRRVR